MPQVFCGAPFLFSNWNFGQVVDTPAAPPFNTYFWLRVPTLITYIDTYHYLNLGRPVGTISIRNIDTAQVYGPFQAVGHGGQGGVVNASWVCDGLNLSLPAGNYIVQDSDPETWSWNYRSGFSAIRGIASYRVSFSIRPEIRTTYTPGVDFNIAGRAVVRKPVSFNITHYGVTFSIGNYPTKVMVANLPGVVDIPVTEFPPVVSSGNAPGVSLFDGFDFGSLVPDVGVVNSPGMIPLIKEGRYPVQFNITVPTPVVVVVRYPLAASFNITTGGGGSGDDVGPYHGVRCDVSFNVDGSTTVFVPVTFNVMPDSVQLVNVSFSVGSAGRVTADVAFDVIEYFEPQSLTGTVKYKASDTRRHSFLAKVYQDGNLVGTYSTGFVTVPTGAAVTIAVTDIPQAFDAPQKIEIYDNNIQVFSREDLTIAETMEVTF